MDDVEAVCMIICFCVIALVIVLTVIDKKK